MAQNARFPSMVKGAGLKIRCVVLHGFKSHPRNHNTPTGFGGLGFAMFLPVFPFFSVVHLIGNVEKPIKLGEKPTFKFKC